MLLSGSGEGGDSKLRPKSEDDAAVRLWAGLHSGRSSKGPGRRGRTQLGHGVGRRLAWLGAGGQAREQGRIPQASWAWLLLQERAVGTRGRIETIA